MDTEQENGLNLSPNFDVITYKYCDVSCQLKMNIYLQTTQARPISMAKSSALVS